MALQAVDYPSFKLLIVGDGGTGKTALVKRHLSGDFERNYKPTKLVEAHMLDFPTNRGKISFTCWDIAADNRHRLLHYFDADCAIIMFDVTARLTYNNVPTWYRGLYSARDNIPIVLCGNKVDMITKRVQAKPLQFQRRRFMKYFEISVKSNYNIEEPFLYLARKLIRDEKVFFVESPALAPPEFQIDMTAQQQHETEIAEAAKQPLPDAGDAGFNFYYQDRFQF